MGAGARLDADQTPREICKELSDLRARETLSEYDDVFGIDAMRLKHVLRDIETHCDNGLQLPSFDGVEP
ncbi:hypothetical protein DSM104635_00373 [Terricaulis silvestris]|uniref:Uncharacterized protein n=1 Tax=Terricaulis silvestris TaxID=2686094 RepID=A0A6I6MIK4_9CAUL|nr:hypothetical protein DSM104635_00373 [Terricaulis silvestris]